MLIYANVTLYSNVRATECYLSWFSMSPLRGREEGIKNEVLRQFLGLKLGQQGEGGGSRNPKLGETSFMDAPLKDFCLFLEVEKCWASEVTNYM